MSWTDSYVTINCPHCHGNGMSYDRDGVALVTCKTCKGLRLVRVPEHKLAVYDPDEE